MLRSWMAILALLMMLNTNVEAQTRRTNKKAAKKPQPSITVDTNAVKPAVTVVAPHDTTKSDSTKLEKVADVVHDSVKAQLKAPIVQVPVTLKSLIVPGILVGYGIVTQNNGGLRLFNDETKEALWSGKENKRPYVEDYLLLVPAAAVYGLNAFGVHGQNNLVDRSIIYGMSNAMANGIIFGLKYFGIEQRPDSSDNYSFASGHTAEAFVSAEFFHQEYKGRLHWTATAGAYAVAIGVGYLRMYHNKHWLSDVVAGAGIGIASTRFSYYLYPAIKHWIFGSKKVMENTAVYPMYNGNGAYGLGLVHRF